MDGLKGATVAVTGATGFLGGRLVERLLLGHGAHVRALVRNPVTMSRLARWPVDVVYGEPSDVHAVTQLATGADVVFHLAHDFSLAGREATSSAAGAITNLSRAIGTSGARLVHVSTADVYGWPASGVLQERRPHAAVPGSIYSEAKIEAERALRVLTDRGDVDAVVVQPTIVYGPNSRPWTDGIVAQLQSGRVLLPAEGEGHCHAVYVDDVVQAMLLAATASGISGERFLVCGPDWCTWEEYYLRFARLLDLEDRVVSLPSDEVQRRARDGAAARTGLKDIVRDPTTREMLKGVPVFGQLMQRVSARLPESRKEELFGYGAFEPVRQELADTVPDGPRHRLLENRTTVDLSHAADVLGYEPAWDLDRGFAMTADYLRWANRV